MSSSSSHASGRSSKIPSSRITWHVEHAIDPSHAPAQRGFRACAAPLVRARTFQVDAVLVRNLQQIFALLGHYLGLTLVLENKNHPDAAWVSGVSHTSAKHVPKVEPHALGGVVSDLRPAVQRCANAAISPQPQPQQPTGGRGGRPHPRQSRAAASSPPRRPAPTRAASRCVPCATAGPRQVAPADPAASGCGGASRSFPGPQGNSSHAMALGRGGDPRFLRPGRAACCHGGRRRDGAGAQSRNGAGPFLRAPCPDSRSGALSSCRGGENTPPSPRERPAACPWRAIADTVGGPADSVHLQHHGPTAEGNGGAPVLAAL